jgi:hypothetical protein
LYFFIVGRLSGQDNQGKTTSAEPPGNGDQGTVISHRGTAIEERPPRIGH